MFDVGGVGVWFWDEFVGKWFHKGWGVDVSGAVKN